ncbi:hypothetical protein SAMN05444365_102271 [Micromonospora pattaloongensis]|uniref:Uncharacterized protein n=1 Tax=Micromonospora pattaloongensis TaxID=405436 RepID=A0A1H3JVY0_9ACTN|nr:hypothetical protein SAMN05444365_102271 [Micromonospora pattaloongensis]
MTLPADKIKQLRDEAGAIGITAQNWRGIRRTHGNLRHRHHQSISGRLEDRLLPRPADEEVSHATYGFTGREHRRTQLIYVDRRLALNIDPYLSRLGQRDGHPVAGVRHRDVQPGTGYAGPTVGAAAPVAGPMHRHAGGWYSGVPLNHQAEHGSAEQRASPVGRTAKRAYPLPLHIVQQMHQ